jgi:hypothetical protein
MNGLFRVALTLLAMLLTPACLGKASFRWKKEVLLHDGRVIVSTR